MNSYLNILSKSIVHSSLAITMHSLNKKSRYSLSNLSPDFVLSSIVYMDSYPSAAHNFQNYLLRQFPKQLSELLRMWLQSGAENRS